MLRITNKINSFVHGHAVLYSFLFAAALALLPISTTAQCAKWDATGTLGIWQTGLRSGITLKIEQNGALISGTATNHNAYNENKGFGRESKVVSGTIDGTINGDSLNFQIFWPEGLTGVYTARILPSGRLDGETYDKSRPNVRQTWHSDQTLKCAPVPVPVPVVSRPPKSTGKAKTPPVVNPPKSTGKAKQKAEPAAASPMKVPGIVASQVFFSQPAEFMGFTVLTWDAGPDHPYAEVWYRVNNGDETFLVEQGKGSRQVPVERGKYYTYILTDAGKTLATISVVGN